MLSSVRESRRWVASACSLVVLVFAFGCGGGSKFKRIVGTGSSVYSSKSNLVPRILRPVKSHLPGWRILGSTEPGLYLEFRVNDSGDVTAVVGVSRGVPLTGSSLDARFTFEGQALSPDRWVVKPFIEEFRGPGDPEVNSEGTLAFAMWTGCNFDTSPERGTAFVEIRMNDTVYLMLPLMDVR